MITPPNSLGPLNHPNRHRRLPGFPDMSDQVCDSHDHLRGDRAADHATPSAPTRSWADGSMIAVTAEMIYGRYLPAIPADSEDRTHD
jgi:hypothetical protein